MLDLPVRAGVRHGGPIDADVVFIAESKELFPMNCVPLSIVMEFGTPKRWTISRKNSTACSDLIIEISRASIHFVNLSTVTSKCV